MYQQLKQKMQEIKNLDNMQSLMVWDMETYMPVNASEDRGEVLSTLAKIRYDKFIDDELYSIVEKLSGDSSLDEIQKKNVDIIRDDIRKTRKIPSSLIQELASQESRTNSAWKQAREEENFGIFAEEFKKFLELRKKEAESVGYRENIYDYFIDKFDPGTKASDIDGKLGELKNKLLDLIPKIKEPDHELEKLLNCEFDQGKIRSFAERMLENLGYDFTRGRLDVSVHPFTLPVSANDVRVTTRVTDSNLVNALMSTIHEMGHAFCELGGDRSQYGLPGGEVRSLALHESQSMIWEEISMNPSFRERFFPVVKEYFPQELSDVSQEDFVKLLHHVNPSLIRTSADQITYHMHIIIRYEIERFLLDGKISVDEMPEIRNQKYREYLGVEPQNLKQGVLQDIHWACGELGYFPVYSLGNMYACRIYQNLDKDMGGVDSLIKEGDFNSIIKWLNTNIHQKGSLYRSQDVINSFSDEKFEIDNYIEFLENKYKRAGMIE